jgi:hypothetical protein
MLEATLVLGALAAVGLAVLLVTLLTAPAMITLALGGEAGRVPVDLAEAG